MSKPKRRAKKRPRVPTAFGARLLAARKAAGLTQDGLADLIGMQSITISRWECGAATPIAYVTLRTLANALGTSVEKLHGEGVAA